MTSFLDYFFDAFDLDTFKVVLLQRVLGPTSVAKPDPFWGAKADFGPNFWVQTDWVGPQDPKTGPIGSG